jgi:hypothetical protein
LECIPKCGNSKFGASNQHLTCWIPSIVLVELAI